MRSGAQLDQREEIPRDPIVLRSAARDSPSHVIHDTYATGCPATGMLLRLTVYSRDRLLIISRGVSGCGEHRYRATGLVENPAKAIVRAIARSRERVTRASHTASWSSRRRGKNCLDTFFRPCTYNWYYKFTNE